MWLLTTGLIWNGDQQGGPGAFGGTAVLSEVVEVVVRTPDVRTLTARVKRSTCHHIRHRGRFCIPRSTITRFNTEIGFVRTLCSQTDGGSYHIGYAANRWVRWVSGLSIDQAQAQEDMGPERG